VKANPIYKNDNNGYFFQRLINCYVELDGQHRFKDDAKWGEVLTRYRKGELTSEDLDYINERVVPSNEKLPEGIQFAVHENQDKDRLNTIVFHEETLVRAAQLRRTENTLLVLASNVMIKDMITGNYHDANNFEPFFQNCSEDDIKYKGMTLSGPKTYHDNGRVDPLLKLRLGCRVMISSNLDVEHGIAKGTRAKVTGIKLKNNVVPFGVKLVNDGGIVLDAVRSDEIEYIELQHENEDIVPQTFKLFTEKYNAFATLPVPSSERLYVKERRQMEMKFEQFPLTLNDATTVHKLQGSSVHKLYIYSWCHQGNWVYVALSRVRTHNGLYLRSPLEIEDIDNFQMHPDLKRMLNYFSENCAPESLPPNFYLNLK
jgi:hypothetical protein